MHIYTHIYVYIGSRRVWGGQDSDLCVYIHVHMYIYTRVYAYIGSRRVWGGQDSDVCQTCTFVQHPV